MSVGINVSGGVVRCEIFKHQVYPIVVNTLGSTRVNQTIVDPTMVTNGPRNGPRDGVPAMVPAMVHNRVRNGARNGAAMVLGTTVATIVATIVDTRDRNAVNAGFEIKLP